MKIVFLTSSYYPFFSAIGRCVKNIVEEIENDHEVIVISNMSKVNLNDNESYCNHEIIRIRPKNLLRRDVLNQNEHPKSSKMLNYFFRVIDYLQFVCSKQSVQKELTNEYLNELKKIENIDLIVPTCYPFESLLAAQKYVNGLSPNTKIAPLLFDKFSESPTLHKFGLNKKLKYKRHVNLENQMFKDSSRVFHVDSWIDHIKKEFEYNHNMFTHIEHPLVKEIKIEPNHDLSLIKCKDNEYIDVVYSGVLDKKVRPPHRTLKKLAELISINNRIRIHFFTLGNCEDVVKEYSSKLPNNIIHHGYAKTDVVMKQIKKANILLSIGNTDVTLIPSKIFEYMSSGKPIVHFFTEDNDRVNKIISDYGIGFSYDQSDDSLEKITKLNNFIESHKNAYKLFIDVEKTFKTATPNHIANLIINSVK